jgi:hypothetical protein
MSAADLARALGDDRREGRKWRCRRPLHDGRSLVLICKRSANSCPICRSAVKVHAGREGLRRSHREAQAAQGGQSRRSRLTRTPESRSRG